LGSASLFDKENPMNPVNRRISIIVMNKQAQENAMRDEASVNLKSNADEKQIDAAVPK
jgi:chemotaxis protein MotB